jgi:hypothetical protein
MPFPANNHISRREECVCAWSWASVHNSPRLNLTAPILDLHAGCLTNSDPYRYKLKKNDTADVEKSEQHCFDLGFWHPWFLWPGDSLQNVFNTFNVSLGDFCSLSRKNLHSFSVTFSRLDKGDEAQWSNEMLYNEDWTQFIQLFHVSSLFFDHLTLQVTAHGAKLKVSLETYFLVLACFPLFTDRCM